MYPSGQTEGGRQWPRLRRRRTLYHRRRAFAYPPDAGCYPDRSRGCPVGTKSCTAVCATTGGLGGHACGVDELPPELPLLGEVSEGHRLGGGTHSAWLLKLVDGSEVVVKSGKHVPDGLFAAEAEGLNAISATGTLATPAVLHAGPTHLVLEALSLPPVEGKDFWEEAGRAVAALHENAGPAHGWHRDNWLGLLPQRNGWCIDGHEFFINNRVLRFLSENKARMALASDAVSGVERICARLRELVPAMPPVMCHGDLWRGNIVADHDGGPAVVDPAVAYTWAEVDISMMYCEMPPPDRFFDAYHEVHPASPGWQQRMKLLHLRELLSVLAHFGDLPILCQVTVPRVLEVIATYS